MGKKYERYVDGVLVESYDTRTSDDLLAETQEKRKAEYGTIEEQLDLIYWDKVLGTEMWKTHISNIKAKYPKPE